MLESVSLGRDVRIQLLLILSADSSAVFFLHFRWRNVIPPGRALILEPSETVSSQSVSAESYLPRSLLLLAARPLRVKARPSDSATPPPDIFGFARKNNNRRKKCKCSNQTGPSRRLHRQQVQHNAGPAAFFCSAD